jgi:hypothetical protein
MPDQDRSWSPPWPALAAILLAAGGALLYFSPLESARPDTPAIDAEGIGYQDGSARLWQDPFKAADDRRRAERQRREVTDRDNIPSGDVRATATAPANKTSETASRGVSDGWNTHSVGAIQSQIRECDQRCENVLVLPVMLQASPYAELTEQRLRVRVAVLEALARSGYQPIDTEHIGYFVMDWPLSRFNGTADARLAAEFRHEPGTRPARNAGGGELLVPYEWCRPARIKMVGRVTQTDYARVLILWLNEDVMYDAPLTRLAMFLGRIDPTPCGRDVRVIGPRISTTLQAMINEACTIFYTGRDPCNVRGRLAQSESIPGRRRPTMTRCCTTSLGTCAHPARPYRRFSPGPCGNPGIRRACG